MGRKLIDLTGQKFGMLTVTKRAGSIRNKSTWYCNCDCGTTDFVAISSDLKSGNTKSCGCLHKSVVSKIGEKNKKYNNYDLSGEYGIGYTTKSEEFYFDLEDYDKIKDYCWHKDKHGYVVAHIRKSKKYIKMHQLIFNNVDKFIDHINHCVYDNRKINLRVVTHSQNMSNKKIHSNNNSGITGVCWHKASNKWWAYISKNKQRIDLGYFNNFEDAVKARKEAEEKYFGEYSYDNSIGNGGLKYG